MPENLPSASQSPDLFDQPVFSALSAPQRAILRLYFREHWTLIRIAQFLRVSLRTVKRHKAEALELLKTSAREVHEAVEQQEGHVRYTISMGQQRIINAPDTTLQEAARRLLSPKHRTHWAGD